MKPLLVIALIVAAILMAATFGILHNQVSCTVSPDYFTRFKYIQFGIPETVPLRLGAAIVGFGATWWLGLIIGPLMALTALRFSDSRRIWGEGLTADALVMAIAALFSLFGLFIGFQLFPVGSAPPSGHGFYSDVADIAAFNRAGTMHNSSYLGGIVGAFLAWVRMLHRIRQMKRSEAK